jgi:hypothetical protein
MMHRALVFLLLPILPASGQSLPPGVIIDRSPDFERVYVACPSIAILPDGSYVASHSWFGEHRRHRATLSRGNDVSVCPDSHVDLLRCVR